MKPDATIDASFWVHAHRSGLLPYVLDRFAVWYAPLVAAELSDRFPSGREFWRLAHAGLLQEATPQADHVQQFGPGERAAINLALEHRD